MIIEQALPVCRQFLAGNEFPDYAGKQLQKNPFN
jgi:hypothetical protein